MDSKEIILQQLHQARKKLIEERSALRKGLAQKMLRYRTYVHKRMEIRLTKDLIGRWAELLLEVNTQKEKEVLKFKQELSQRIIKRCGEILEANQAVVVDLLSRSINELFETYSLQSDYVLYVHKSVLCEVEPLISHDLFCEIRSCDDLLPSQALIIGKAGEIHINSMQTVQSSLQEIH